MLGVGLGVGLMLVGCGTPEPKKLPSASTNKALARPVASACGLEVAYAGRVELRYRYTNDAFGRIERARGTYVRGGPEHVIDFEYDHLDHMTRRRDTHAGPAQDIVANYNTHGDLVEYVMTFDGETARYRMFDFTELGMPQRQIISQPGQADITVTMDYDAIGRITRAVDTTNSVTTYAYDEAARTIVIDVDAGDVVSVVTYDDENRQISETLSGRDTSVMHFEDTYVWSGDRLQTITRRTSEVVEQQRFLYSCQ